MQLEGDCNRCGQCCTINGYVCINLQIDTTLGEPQSTRCMAYDVRFDGMPIIARNSDGHRIQGVCRKDSPQEAEIIQQWIGRGCSLKRKD